MPTRLNRLPFWLTLTLPPYIFLSEFIWIGSGLGFDFANYLKPTPLTLLIGADITYVLVTPTILMLLAILSRGVSLAALLGSLGAPPGRLRVRGRIAECAGWLALVAACVELLGYFN